MLHGFLIELLQQHNDLSAIHISTLYMRNPKPGKAKPIVDTVS